MNAIQKFLPAGTTPALALAALAVTAVPSADALAQHDPRVEPAVSYAIQGATVHTLSGQTIPNATVVIRDGLIREVGTSVNVPAGASVIEATGLHVYPGLVDAFSRLGLTEIGAVSATQDASELGNWNSHLSAYTAIHPSSEHIPVARANGITHALTAPGSGGGGFFGGGNSGGIAGQATMIHLDGWTVEDMAIEPTAGMVIQWPGIQTRTFDFATFSVKEKPFTEAKKEYDEQVQKLEDWLDGARHYKQATTRGDRAKFQRDLQLEHLSRVIGGELPVIVVANDKRAIEGAMDLAERYDLKLIIASARDAREVKGTLAEKGIPVILGPSQSMPREEDDPYSDPFSLAGELHAAGIKIAFGTFNSSDSRTLPYEAANTVPFGLPKDEALKAVTINSAEILGVADRLGTVEPGKIGNLIVTNGDPLEITTQIQYLFIDGIPVDTQNKHKELWEKHQSRPQKAVPVTTTTRVP